MKKYKFIDGHGTFVLEHPDNYNYLYMPLAGESGIKSAITPTLGGDIKMDQNTFIMEPVSAENLHNNKSSRNFWCQIEEGGCWSATGVSAEQENNRFTQQQDWCQLTGGFMWHMVERSSNQYLLASTITSFVPLEHNIEIMHVQIFNRGASEKTITPIAAIPIYGRSADNMRDHRHVTSLLNRITTSAYGVKMKPVLSFDERGHRKNQMCYFVCGVGGRGEKPERFYPTVEEFIGEGGSLQRPFALLKNCKGVLAGESIAGKEAMGGIRFEKVTLKPQQSVSYTIIIGATTQEEKLQSMIYKYETDEKVRKALEDVKGYWQGKVNVTYHTADARFDNYMKWVSFQPILRRIYGCSFLPFHDYGKGGRGWRDLWQDCLALLIMNPDGVRQMILDNFAGVRMDGTNATIIGAKQGEFIADRNSITRVWMDHGVWPFMTTKFYIDQTGDFELLNEKVSYFKDRQVERGMDIDTAWSDEYGNAQKTVEGRIYQGSVLEHLLLQNLCSFYEVGEHNHMRLRGADWNDALDMAEERGESVAFTCAYAGNMKELAACIRKYVEVTGNKTILLAKEMALLLTDRQELYESIVAKKQLMSEYVKSCRHTMSGEKIEIDTKCVIESLENKADWLMEYIRQNEWVEDDKGNGWFNGYYDNQGNRVEGQFKESMRMMLTGQVFAIMSGTANERQVLDITKSADYYLYKQEAGGYRLNTDFGEEKFDLGRMFGFAYGEKENGAVFSHMTVMYANALYKRGYVKEGYKALQSLADAALDFATSKIYPGIPEYFNAKGQGLYHYLTGSASWYMLTMITQVFGVRGEHGALVIEPKLMAEQFDEKGMAKIQLHFGNKEIEVTIKNPNRLAYGEYKVIKALCNGTSHCKVMSSKVRIEKQELETWQDEGNEITLELGLK
jgi:cellobiose phosphorylase